MYHRMARLDVLMALESEFKALEESELPATFIEYRREKQGKNWIGETTDFVALPERAENKIVPDAGFVIENAESGNRALFLVEVDLGTERQLTAVADAVRQSFRYKIEQYDRYRGNNRR